MKKKLTLEQDKKRQKVRNIIKWVFVGLGWSTLLACFIMLLTLGVKGCNNKTNKSREVESTLTLANLKPKQLEYDAYNEVYYSRFNGDTNIDTMALRDIASYLGYGDTYIAVQPEVVLNDYDYVCAYNSNGEFLPLVRCRVVLRCKQNYSDMLQYTYRLESITLYSDNDNITVASTQTHGYLSTTSVVDFRYNGSIVLRSADNNRSLLKIAYLDPFCSGQVFNPTTYYFNEQINYNAFQNATIDTPFVVGGSTGAQEVYNGVFVSGGEVFDSIKIRYIDANAVYFKKPDASGNIKGSSGSVYFTFLEYWNSTTNRVVVVNQRDMQAQEISGGIAHVVLNSSTWKSQTYRKIIALNGLSDSETTALGRLNNNSSNINNGINGNVDIGDTFTLLGSAFSSWLSIFNISILPGLTLGVFFFLPVIVSIIVLVFKAVKK